MLKKTIPFENLDGVLVREDFYFNLTKAELVQWEIDYNGGLESLLREIAKSEDQQRIMATFRDIIRRAYGRRTASGAFVKKAEFWEEFQHSEAFSVLFMEILENAEAGAAFINNIMPKALMAEVKKTVAERGKTLETVTLEDLPLAVEPGTGKFANLTREEVLDLSQDEFIEYTRWRVLNGY